MQTDNPVLFACYILYVYFNGQNLRGIEREMRSLGYTRFHRRILYPRGPKPGWIAKHGWQSAVDRNPGTPAGITPGNAAALPGNAAALPGNAAALPGNAAALTGNAGALACMSAKHENADEPSADRHSTASPIPPTANGQPPTNFPDWLRTVSSNMTWTWRHQQVIIEQLERVTRGECKRLMIFLPPRHGKSELVTVRYTAWRMQRDPSMNVILGSYNQRLADRFSRKIRKVISDAEVGQTFQSVPVSHSTPSSAPPHPTHPIQEGRLAPALVGQTFQSVLPDNPASTHCEGRLAPGSSGREVLTSTEDRLESLSYGNAASAKRSTSRGEPSCSPFPFISSKPANSVSEWETTMGGGFRSVGVGSGVTGFGASLIVIDDPIKSRAEAESETYRERVWDWFTDDLYTRLEPDGAIVLIQTRWHEDDLAGRLLREASEGGEQWKVVNLPALSEPPVVTGGEDSDGSRLEDTPGPSADIIPPVTTGGSDWRDAPDLPLCPERFDLPALRRIRHRLGEYSFAALYQQRPTPAEGGLFKREWFAKIIPFAPPGLKWKRGYDLAVSTKTNADYTASFRCAFDKEGNLYISGGFRARLEYPDQRRFIIDRIKAEPDTEHGIELALHGQALIQDLRRERGLRGHLLRGVRVEHDKYTRALTWAPLAEEGKVILVRGPMENVKRKMQNEEERAGGSDILHFPFSTFNWVSDFLDEVCSFPSAAHDDQVDAVSLAVQMLKGTGKRSWGF